MPPMGVASDPLSPRRTTWGTCYFGLGAILLCALAARYFLPLYLSGPIGVESGHGAAKPTVAAGTSASLPESDPRIDPNLAGWSELTRLPGIGEVTAKRIVAFREERERSGEQPVFRKPADLARVRGIGPKTVEKLAPLLRFDE